jgi:flagellar assembly factor FliW
MTKSASEVVIESSVYGSLPVKAEQIIRFPKKLVGIPDYSEYALLQLDETAFYLLHALQDDFHFILIPAADVVRDYEFDLSPETVELLGIKEPTEVLPFLIVNIIEEQLFVNLKAPVLVAPSSRTGCQYVIHDKDYPIRQKIFGKETS